MYIYLMFTHDKCENLKYELAGRKVEGGAWMLVKFSDRHTDIKTALQKNLKQDSEKLLVFYLHRCFHAVLSITITTSFS